MNDNTLKSGSLLKHGEYRIERTLGQVVGCSADARKNCCCGSKQFADCHHRFSSVNEIIVKVAKVSDFQLYL